VIIKKPYYITEIIKETPDVTIFRFKSADGSVLDFSPGMFVMLYYKANTPEQIGRAYSIASAPGSDTIELIIGMIHGKLSLSLKRQRLVIYIIFPVLMGNLNLTQIRTKKFFS